MREARGLSENLPPNRIIFVVMEVSVDSEIICLRKSFHNTVN